MSKANSRQKTKNKPHYDAQWGKTRRNKMKRIQQSNGTRFLAQWMKDNPPHVVKPRA